LVLVAPLLPDPDALSLLIFWPPQPASARLAAKPKASQRFEL
jgi:hypothetical protein